MTDQELYACHDHRVWASEFCRIASENGFDPTNVDDVEWVGTWIANAMMNGYDRSSAALNVQAARDAMQEACDLLAERKHGNPARSPGHNARLVLEAALTAGKRGV